MQHIIVMKRFKNWYTKLSTLQTITLKFSLLLVLVCSIIFTIAQVKNTSYNNMLKLMLSKSTPAITIPEAATLLGKASFLDAREYREYEVSHIPEARYVGVSDFTEARLKGLDKAAPIIIYCSVGKRSEDLTLKLKNAGYTDVRNMYGGIFEWVNQGHTVVDMAGKKTDQVHAYSKFWGKWLTKGTKVYK